MGDDLGPLEREILRLRDRYHNLDATVRGLAFRVDELDQWRDRDEPRIVKLVNDASIADEVRTALRERTRRELSLGQKFLAAVIGIPVFVGSLASLANYAHHLFG